jgi:O-antigen/teichoic acid export membrane protein
MTMPPRGSEDAAGTVSGIRPAGGVLARNAGLNLVGLAAPMVVAVVAIPILVSSLGVERFGVLTLAWMAIGYFSIFDFGLGRALTQRVAMELGAGREQSVPTLVRTTLVMMVGLGMVGALVLVLIAPWLVGGALRIPAELQAESLRAIRILAPSLPFVIATTGLRGLLEAKQRFGLINAVRVPMGALTFLGPVLVLPFSVSLVPIVSVLVASRMVGFVVHAVMCASVLPGLARSRRLAFEEVPPLLRTGGWMTVSNVVSPLMVYLDRFVIGAMMSMAAVAYYVTPYELVTRLWVIPSALMGVLFPAFAGSFTTDRGRTAELMDHGVRATFVALFPIVLLLVAFAAEGLAFWVGSDFAANSTPILQLLAVGVLVNSVGQVPYSVVQAVGRADITGKLHLAELPIYLAALWWLIGEYGIVGAAAAWVLRVTIDTAALFAVASRLVPGVRSPSWRSALVITAAVASLAVVAHPAASGARLLIVGSLMIAFVIIVWRGMLAPEERAMVQLRLRARPEGR